MNNTELINQAVRDRKVITGKEFTDEKVLHIAHSGTSNYLNHTGVTMTSFLVSNPGENFCFHLFVNGLTHEDEAKMHELADHFHCRIEIYYVNDEIFKAMLHRDGIAAFFYRFIIPPVLAQEGIKRVLYTDGDIMCQGPIRPLMDVDLEGKITACVRDKSDEVAEQKRKKLGTKQYFNSGVMLIDIDGWNKKGLTEEACHMAIERRKKSSSLNTHDQNILNKLLDDDVKMVSPIYNTNYNTSMKSIYQHQDVLHYDRDIVLVHFSGIVKPWRTWVRELPGVAKYCEFWEVSPWKDIPPVGPKTHKDCHQAARSCRRFGHYGEMMHWYKEYIVRKYIRHQ